MTTESDKSLTILKDNAIASSSIWSLYIVQTRFGHWYTGISTDVSKRFASHQAGKGAKNLRGKGPLTLIYQQEIGDRSAATKLEIKVKKLSKQQKQRFMQVGHLPTAARNRTGE
ncbi:hypothetical protein AMS58_01590 [Pseudoalteromonas porphyrae]|uniref:GIY-YIG domain-containing protein n=1 Tax=Pseudoalteromonas porphyrae TaxID=187330 RepID=A0A0N1MTE3_9GAMM|nr:MULTISPECIES: GIY-YIG nuclease family protein [Pseudoalteromonas]KPH63972.1 hypothetical protein ADS77_08690 [Pseudoalteromonas porphyrae]KPH96277.1 hypothetical protein AMS58_01590 [Pseudoalteromonas porphyrae]